MSSNIVKQEASTDQKFKVVMHPDMVNELDECFSPMDGIQAIGEIFGDLPRVHRNTTARNKRHVGRRVFRIFTGRFNWFPIGFTYVQIGNLLRVLEFWYDEDYHGNRIQELDSVIGVNPDNEEFIISLQDTQTSEDR